MFKKILILMCFVSLAWTCTETCAPWDGQESTGFLQIWSGPSFTGEFQEYRSSRRICDNVGWWAGARSVRSASTFYECKIYSQINCFGRENYADAHGWANPPFPVQSFSCPWRCF